MAIDAFGSGKTIIPDNDDLCASALDFASSSTAARNIKRRAPDFKKNEVSFDIEAGLKSS